MRFKSEYHVVYTLCYIIQNGIMENKFTQHCSLITVLNLNIVNNKNKKIALAVRGVGFSMIYLFFSRTLLSNYILNYTIVDETETLGRKPSYFTPYLYRAHYDGCLQIVYK
jgi:hypothetical protein